MFPFVEIEMEAERFAPVLMSLSEPLVPGGKPNTFQPVVFASWPEEGPLNATNWAWATSPRQNKAAEIRNLRQATIRKFLLMSI